MLKSHTKATGRLHIVNVDASGAVKDDVLLDNLVVDVGLAFLASRAVGATANVMSHMGLGSGAVAPAHGDLALGTELGRAALTSATASGSVVTYVATFNPGVATGNITEAAVFNAPTAGTMLNRATFGIVTKAAGDTMTITWTVTLS
jgi:hypothetical protein